MKTTRLAPVQKVYLAAKAAHEQAKADAKAECAALGLATTDDMTEEECMPIWEKIDDIEVKHGVWQLHDEKIKAEKALVKWGLDRAADFAPHERETIEILRGKAERVIAVRGQLAEITMRLHA